eukprot:1143657-Pelagomonas_calceolata.AAC.5
MAQTRLAVYCGIGPSCERQRSPSLSNCTLHQPSQSSSCFTAPQGRLKQCMSDSQSRWQPRQQQHRQSGHCAAAKVRMPATADEVR